MSDRPALDPSRLARLDPDVAAGLHVEVVAEATSTNVLVADRARAGEPEGLVVVAEHQTAGRGRLDRTWETPARSALTFSLLLRPTAPTASWPWVPLLTGHEVAKALVGVGYAVGVKWPNDLLVEDRKVAGVLAEVVDTVAGPALVVGVGVNVSTTEAELPVPTATSLLLAGGAAGLPDRTDLLIAILQTLWEGYLTWQAGSEAATARLASSYAAACVTVGRTVRVDLPAGGGAVDSVTGTATGIDADGRLRVDTGAGEMVVGAGDVVHVRAV